RLAPTPKVPAAPPRPRCSPPARPRPGRGAGVGEPPLPEGRVLLLHLGEIAVHRQHSRPGFAIGHGAIARGAVDLVLPVLSIALDVLCRGHDPSRPASGSG